MRAKLNYIFLFISGLSIQMQAQEFYSQESNLGISESFGNHIFDGGGGISFVDFNDDGLDDLTFSTEQGKDVLFYKNNGFSFELVDPPYVDNTDETKQIVWVDFDEDGDKDLFLSTFDAVDRLYENDGNMVFTDVTNAVGLPMNITDTHSINFGDLDQNGSLELYYARYGEEIVGDTNSLFTYNYVTGIFDCVTSLSGTDNGFQQSLATAFFDFDNDGDLDIYISNDRLVMGNALYMNLGNLNFVDVSVPSQTNAFVFAMNAGIGDFNMDGFMDVYITNIDDAVLYQNNGNNTFSDVAVSTGSDLDRFGWGANFFDFDNDKDLDLYVTTTIVPNKDSINAFLINQSGLSFSEPYLNTGGLGGDDDDACFSNAYGDLNNNGKLDFAVSKNDDKEFDVWINQTDVVNNFIKLDLIGVDSHLEAFGARVDVWIDGQKTVITKHCTVGYQSQHTSDLVIGLGTASAVDSLIIKWPYLQSVDTISGSTLLINGMNEITENVGVSDTYSQSICGVGNILVPFNPIPSQTFGAGLDLASTSLVPSNSDVHFQSQKRVSLDIGFEVEVGAVFEAEINICGN